ncbi:hypothetical protein GCM10010112_81940 [Actinoplanes lobatus]|uniref:Uncharacterized protein n=1 Tax=Actinoplanes lobatus TaxID=113568 RepID=A0A7W7HL88_9ACTN|nr:hypothetical protein [Actinoplanes lobatus]MBB4752607.1 hypothetical protein [Actinoplanes lobatus]GGN93559.1 hypothetical protein GCM10010112_81940 [Actinoplanes lobatus]
MSPLSACRTHLAAVMVAIPAFLNTWALLPSEAAVAPVAGGATKNNQL